MKLLIVTALAFFIAGTALAGTITVPLFDNSANRVKKLIDGDVVCYIFDSRELSCVK